MDKDKEKVHPFSGGYAKVPDAVDAAALPDGEDQDYKAAGTADSHEIPCLVVIMGKEGLAPGGASHYAFEYAHIGNLELGFAPGGGVVFRFLYSGLQPKLVIVHGDLLLKTWHLIALRRMAWIRQADRSFRPAGAGKSKETVITKIEVLDWKRPASQAAELAEALEELEDA